jgi:hypothetical protein
VAEYRATRKCRNCGKVFDNTVKRQQKYCGDECRKKYLAMVKAANKAEIDAIPNQKELSTYTKVMKKLAFENIEDEIRETLREETRKQVTEHLKDNILGATEALTGLLPLVLEGLANDVQHEDWMRRSRAQAMVMKYAFAYKDAEAQGNDSRQIYIVHNVPVPDSPLGDRMIEAQQDRIEAESEARMVPATLVDPDADPNEYVELPPEMWEADWPVCITCNERKHPDTFATMSDRDPLKGRCRTCEYTQEIRSAFRSGYETTGRGRGQNEQSDWNTAEFGPEG